MLEVVSLSPAIMLHSCLMGVTVITSFQLLKTIQVVVTMWRHLMWKCLKKQTDMDALKSVTEGNKPKLNEFSVLLSTHSVFILK